MLFFTGVSATGNTLAVNVFVRPETTANQPLAKTYRGCKNPLLTRYPQPFSDPMTPTPPRGSGGSEKGADPTQRGLARILQDVMTGFGV